MYELYKGASILVDYNMTHRKDVIAYFEENSNFEGWATLHEIDEENGLFWTAEMPLTPLSVDVLILMNQDSNEFEYYKKEK